MVSVDLKKNLFGKYKVFSNCGKKNTGLDVLPFVQKMEKLGAGELFLNSIDQDGTYKGYDLQLIKSVSEAINIPVVACGGASDEDDLVKAIKKGGASASAAGSIFVYQGIHKGVLITYPKWNSIQERLK